MAKRAYSRAGIVARLFNQPLAVLPETAAIVLGAIGQRFDVQQLFVASDGSRMSFAELDRMAADSRAEIDARSSTDRLAKNAPAERLMFVHNGVAHVGVRGETVAENGIGPVSGFTGYDGIVASVQSADADPAVKGILLDIDSPGGEVSGMFEAAAILMGRSGAKPMRAMIRGVGASAAYALACCADEITLHEFGTAGSIGCISMHADFSQALAQEGVKVTLFASGAHKADGNPFEPLSEDVASRVQAQVDTVAAKFIAHVAETRGLSEEAVRAQQAQCYYGEEAVAAGLVDKIMGWQDSMDEFEAMVNAPASARGPAAPAARSAKGSSMSTSANAPAADQQPEFTQTQLDAVRAEGHAAGLAEGTKTSAEAERTRFTQLATIDGESKLSAGLTEAIAAGTSAGDFAVALATAKKAKLDGALAGAQADAVKPSDLPDADAAAAAGGAAPKVNRGQAAVERNRGKIPGLPAGR